ncbi:MAG: hypothetical protein NVSMB24_22400 [Mucilaginibacter sp.]
MHYSQGSLSETLDHLIVALDEKIITEETLSDFEKEYDYCLKLINGYLSYLKKKKNNELE